MNSDKILTLLLLVVAVVAAFVEIPLTGLALLALGLVSGFLNPINEIMERTAYLLVAVAAPVAANNLDLIPVVGSYLNAIIDGIAIGAAGMWLSNFSRALVSRVTPSS